MEVLTGHGTRTGKIKQYCDKVVKLLDNLVTVAKSSYTLKQQGRSSAENLAFAKEILFTAEDIEERLEYLHMFGSKIIDEYQKIQQRGLQRKNNSKNSNLLVWHLKKK